MKSTLIDRFRRVLHDVRYSRRAVGLSVAQEILGPGGSAIAEIAQGRLMVTTMGLVGVPSISIDLSHPHYDSIDKLRRHLDLTPGYVCTADEDIMGDHPSADLEPFGPTPILGTGIDLKHHTFSDLELVDILTDAIRRHNPSLSLMSLPEGEEPFVLSLAHSAACKILAFDAAKRKGTDATVESLLALARSLEDSYKFDVGRVSKALQPTKEPNGGVLGQGDIVLGTLFRASPRTGYHSPLTGLPPDAAVLLDGEQVDAEDESIRIRWERNTTSDLWRLELWMDTRPEVTRNYKGIYGVRIPDYTVSAAQRDMVQVGTARLVARSYGGGMTLVGLYGEGAAYQEQSRGTNSCVVAGLEPNSTYYFRLFVVDLNGMVASSKVISVQTKTLRTRFALSTWASRTYAAPGEEVTIFFDQKYAPFTAKHKITMDGKDVTVVSFTAYSAVIEVPDFFQKNIQHMMVLESPNGLVDVRPSFTVVNP